ncbi:hypothetical protein [Paenibacillus woosongensis]|uniref:Uncharacterized protein n=2 Tax=Paenibacillus TaxID=44249 RepID=A0ABQ4MLX6_9BACL|nr:hypothetical protein [Paenibacillus woosongensis]GIP57006.1 hypothetical protein J15TS10_08200 [Paenibacillus woosongensis]
MGLSQAKYIAAPDKQADPAAYQRFIDEIDSGNHGLDELVKFAKKVPSHTEWIEKYKETNAQVLEYLQNLKRDNRFEQADYSSIKAFRESVQGMLSNAAVGTGDFYVSNMQYFASLLAD